MDNNEAVDFQKTLSVQNVFQEKPRLSMDTMEFEEDSSDEVTVVKQDEPKPKEKKKLDSFIQVRWFYYACRISVISGKGNEAKH